MASSIHTVAVRQKSCVTEKARIIIRSLAANSRNGARAKSRKGTTGAENRSSKPSAEIVTGRFQTGKSWKLIIGDSRNAFEFLDDSSVDCIITSPPYYWQRDYEVEGQIGHEPSIEGYVTALVACFSGLKAKLKDDGLLFLNLGDTYYSAKGKPHGHDKKHHARQLSRKTLRAVDGPGLGLPRKSLIGIPWRVALEMQKAGWTLRSDVLWRRPGAMPEPTAHDRPQLTHEHVFIFSKRPRYYFDRAALEGDEDFWHIRPTPDRPGAHFAPFPSTLVEKCIKCGCRPHGTVLDPFAGSGTTMAVAGTMNRSAVGIELNRKFAAYTVTRLNSVTALVPKDGAQTEPQLLGSRNGKAVARALQSDAIQRSAKPRT